MPGVLGLNGSRFVGVPGATGVAGGFVLTVVRVRASEERAALNLLADASGFSGVEVREDSDELEIEVRRLEANNEVGFKRRLGACVSVEAMVETVSVVPDEPERCSVALAIFNRVNILHRDLARDRIE